MPEWVPEEVQSVHQRMRFCTEWSTERELIMYQRFLRMKYKFGWLVLGLVAFLSVPIQAEVQTVNVTHSAIKGIGVEKGVMRRDPSDVIKVGDLFYVWYSKGKIAPGYDATVWYATSPDGQNWTEKGMALAKGVPGSWEGASVFTPNILVAEGKYWLFYTGVSREFKTSYNPDSKIGIAVSDSPDGPWERLASNPALKNSDNPSDFDSHLVDDACLIARDGKYWFYYKGRQLGKSPAQTQMGLAIADKPQGPYVRVKENPVIPGNHEVLVWPQGKGVVAMIGSTGPKHITNTIQYAEDGIHFTKTHDVKSGPWAGGTYRPEAFTDSGTGSIPEWGVEIGRGKGQLPFLGRFDLAEKSPTESASVDVKRESAARTVKRPNVVVIFADDLGYGDLGCFGSKTIKTPHIDRMAKDGLRLTNFYAQTVCGPSRASLMTGCYPLRVAVEKNRVEVHPRLHTSEITIAEVLKKVGYTSAAFGKWDLAGHSQTDYSRELLPTRQGFDYFFGTPTSNDSIVNLIRNEEVIERKADMSTLTRRYTDEAIAFIKRSKEKPFFVYLAHTMPHVRLATSEQFKGKSDGGLYGDVVEEIDLNVGRILQTLQEEGLEKDTYVIFTSDNGPWYFGRSPGHLKRMGEDWASHGGVATPLRGAKTSAWEGGLRVPCVVWAPGNIPSGSQSDAVTSTMDILPTFAKLARAQVPVDRVIDGRDISAIFQMGKETKIKSKPFFYYRKTRLAAVRFGKWKLHVVRPVDTIWQKYSAVEDAIAITRPVLYNLETDIVESNDVSTQYPEVVEELMRYIEQARDDIGDYNRIGKNARFFDPEPRRPDIEMAEKK